ncbi:uncharacterized protein [Anabrus simplex]|uniref:uncharacterized protein n=1 Tax=Anabrus simplex TaxID=316456 RepID=UPI0035A2F24F
MGGEGGDVQVLTIMYRVLLLATLLSTATSEIEDVTKIYRIHHNNDFRGRNNFGDSFSVEIHLRTNALGKLVKATNGSYLDPFSDMPQFQCIPTGNDCTWGQRDNWIVNMVEMRPFELSDKTFSCEVNNGGCQVNCYLSNFEPVCSCPNGYSLNDDRRTCSGDSSRNYILTDDSGSFSTPYYPNSQNTAATWLLVTHQDHKITLDFPAFERNVVSSVEVYDGPSTNAERMAIFRDSRPFTSLQSTGNTMFITFYSGYYDYGPKGFRASFTTAPRDATVQPILTLSNYAGSLGSMPFVPKSNGICVSIIYKLEPSSEMWVSALLDSHSNLNLTKDVVGQVEEWEIGRFTGVLLSEQMGKPITLSAHFIGMNSSVLSISGCNPFDKGDVYLLHNSVPINQLPASENARQSLPESPQKCYNGGIYLEETKECICPSGFTGLKCEEGCGPNRYGNDCEGICSGLMQGCKEMIFCKRNLPCMCAPGFTGGDCSSEYIREDYYGAGGRLQCGHCVPDYGSCNIYTGECESGCRNGYYPPLCQDKYHTLSVAPEIKLINTSSVLITADGSSLDGRGSVKFFQVQYKEKESLSWLKLQPREPVNGSFAEILTELQPAVWYDARIILIDIDGNSNQDVGVPIVTFQTPCTVPTSKEYHLKSDRVTSSSFKVSWQYDELNSTSCPLTGFEILFRDQWEEFTQNKAVGENAVEFSHLIPRRTYLVAVKALTDFGPAPLSSALIVTTADDAPGRVTSLQAKSEGPGMLRISWNKPRLSEGIVQHYRIEYKCLQLLACSLSCQHSRGELNISATVVTLSGLHPHAQYMINVSAETAYLGPSKSIVTATQHTGASVAPGNSSTPIIHRSNTCIAVQWEAPADCLWLNGYLYGYRYQLVSRAESKEHILYSGMTQNTRINFTDLTPHMQYEVWVYVVTSGGWNESHKLVIPISTRATVPEPVQNLTVYKRAQRLIGIRWALPLKSYGPIKSFKVTYKLKNKSPSEEVSKIIDPVPCTAWPDMYCHTINGLIPDEKYVVSVQARNKEVDSDGTPATITGITREIAPGAPSALRILNRTQTRMVLEWGPPLMLNGVLRSFIVNVEEIDSRNSSTCCDYFPIQELPVRTEEQLYQLEVNGLNPASTLVISVSAKTITLGPAVNLTASTPPETPTIVHPPELQPRVSEDELFSVSVRPSEIHPGLQSTYMLLILPSEARPDPVIWDNDLLLQLKSVVNNSFYPVAELKSETLLEEEDIEIYLGTGALPRNGTLAVVEDPVLLPGMYRVGLALILDYCGSKSVGFAASSFFEVS